LVDAGKTFILNEQMRNEKPSFIEVPIYFSSLQTQALFAVVVPFLLFAW